jgi:hypothetical protein
MGRQSGFGYLRDPILQPLDNIETGDALIRTKGDGTVVEAEWPEAEFVIGNPPFLGGKLLRRGPGDDYGLRAKRKLHRTSRSFGSRFCCGDRSRRSLRKFEDGCRGRLGSRKL